MGLLDSFFNQPEGLRKPGIKWIERYLRDDGVVVEGHWRTEENKTINDNLSTDVDKDGITGFFDADENGDGIFEAHDLNGDGIADIFQSLDDLSS